MDVPEILDVILVLLFGTGVSWVCQRYRLPAAVAHVLLGVILGGAVLGWVSHGTLIHFLGEIGVILLLGAAGLEIGVERLKEAGSAGIAVALLGILFSLSGGYFLGRFFGSLPPEAFYIGLMLAATSIGIGTQILQQYRLIDHRVGEIVIAAAVIDDVIALYLLAAAHGILSNNAGITDILVHLVGAIALFGSLYWLTKSLTSSLIRLRWIGESWLLVAWVIGAIFASALLSDALEFSAVVGGFFAGVGIGDGLKRDVRQYSIHAVEPLIWITMPFFFVMIGVQAQWTALSTPGSRWFLLLLLAIAVFGKALGGFLGAAMRKARERWLIGFSMVARGEVALVIATLGLQQGHIADEIFVSLVLATISLAVLGPLLMTPFAKSVAADAKIAGAH
jgi:Kef-type K+ transport system membrane component KefB